MTALKNSIHFTTYGCRLNQAETARLREQAIQLGFFIGGEGSGLLIINSCSVTDKAQKELETYLKKQKIKFPDQKVYLMGCGARDSLGNFGTILKNKDKEKIFDILKPIGSTGGGGLSTEIERVRVNYKIQDGCNNFCSYCIVPFLRGREVSISDKKVIQDLKNLEIKGTSEVVLTGVNIGKYSYGKKDLTLLIDKILEETSIPRIRLSSINPEDISSEMIQLWNENPRLCRHLHISLQSGSDTVLHKMKRNYDTELYRKIIQKICKKMPEVTITTDIIVGFPGETDEEFGDTLRFAKEMNFYKIHIFRYSKRDGTVATSMKNQVPERTKRDRAQKLAELDKNLRHKIQRKYIGKEVEVLFENKKNGYYSGHTGNYIKVNVDSSDRLANQFKKIVILELKVDGLWAILA